MRFGALVAVLALTAASAAFAAPGTGSTGSGATAQQLGTRTQQALLGLYALDSRLQAWRGRLASLQTAAAAMRERQATLRKELHADRVALGVSERHLALALRALYERGNVSAVAVVLGAKSLSTGLSQLDDMSRVAEQSR